MIGIQRYYHINVVDIDGELSRHNMKELDRTLNSLSRSSQYNIVLDFNKLKHLDYRLVQKIADRIVEFQCDGGDIKLAGASEYIKNILDAMGLEDEVYFSVHDALLSFLREAPLDAMQ